MKCLILAAGKGERLRINGNSKPLVQLLGLTLIERVIYTCKSEGIEDFYIVVGYKKEEIKEKLGSGKRYGVKITYIENEEWHRGNGVSVLKARNFIDGTLILLMSDHIFDGKILSKLKKNGLGEKEVILCIDKMKGDYIDVVDATKVKVENNRLVDIGKDITDYDAYDTGIFLSSHAIFDALQQSIAHGDDSLSGSIRYLSKEGQVGVLDIGNAFWIDIDDKKSLKNAERTLCSRLKKATDGPISKLVNRPISIRITKQFLKFNITPNIITLFSFLIALIASLLFFLGGYLNLLLGGCLVQLSSIIDGCDGEVARLKYCSSEYGGWLDAILDRYADAFIILGLAHHYWLGNHHSFAWIIGFFALMGVFLNSYTADKYDSYLTRKFSNKHITLRLGRDVRLFIIFIGALFNQVLMTLIILSIVTNLEVLRRIYILRDEKN